MLGPHLVRRAVAGCRHFSCEDLVWTRSYSCAAGAAFLGIARFSGAAGTRSSRRCGSLEWTRRLPLTDGARVRAALSGFSPFHITRPNLEALWKLPLPRIGDHATPSFFSMA